ncbi:hypothetical protein EC988_006829, partial [Linderina pennispora]
KAAETAKKAEHNKRGPGSRRTRAKTEGTKPQEKPQAVPKQKPARKNQARRKTEAATENSPGLQRAMIVQGENGRARVLFSGLSSMDQVAEEAPRRASVSAHGSARGRYDGLSLVGSPSSMRSAVALPLVNGLINSHRQRSLTAAQPQPVQMARVQPVEQPRTRSQTVSSHVSETGLRISMAQARPGNVLAPHVPLAPRAPGMQSNAYATGGYFAKRRASVSNVGLAVDPSHSIRIPAIMFQKPADLEQPGAPHTPVSNPNTPDPKDGEGLAMKRLQDMISSMRNLTPKQPLKPAEITLPPTPAAHPTSRFDSILEEDEDDEAEEQELIDEPDSTPVSHSQTVLAA